MRTRAGRGLREPGDEPIAVDDQQSEGGQHPEHQEDVEDRGAAQHQLEAVEREQEPGHAPEHRRPGHSPGNAGQDQDGQGADHGRRESPAERREAERPLPERHHDLAERRVAPRPRAGTGRSPTLEQDVGLPAYQQLVDVLDVLQLDAVMEDRVRVRHVVRLVEDDSVRLAQPVEPQEAAEDHDEHRPGPAPERAAEYERAAPAAGPASAASLRRCRRPTQSGRRSSTAMLGARPASLGREMAQAGDARSSISGHGGDGVRRGRSPASRGGTLTVAAAPIGQPADASGRLAEALASAAVIAAEDTRRLRRLAAALGVRLAGRVLVLLRRRRGAARARRC